MNTEQRHFLEACRKRYIDDLTGDIMPFWLDHGLDRVYGGVYTCLDRDGTLMDTTKSVWFQGRFAYVCASAFNKIEQAPQWIEASKSALDFIEAHCRDTDGHMFFTVTETGGPVQKRRYVFSECFAASAMAEYAVASGDGSYAEKAVAEFRNILRMLSTLGFLPPKTAVPSIGHSITMILINVAKTIRQVSDDPALDARIDESVDLLRRRFMHPEFGTVLETVGPEGEFIDTIAGRTVNPGHCMETGWFLLDLARSRGWDKSLVEMGLTIIDWAWNWGWDEEFGGLINFKDCRNFPSQDYSQDMKFWWPQCETIIASLYAYLVTGDGRYLEMHRKAHEWAYAHLPDREYGEWYGYLHRNGTVAQPAKGNIFKGPFHIPRMMIEAYRLCGEILEKDTLLSEGFGR